MNGIHFWFLLSLSKRTTLQQISRGVEGTCVNAIMGNLRPLIGKLLPDCLHSCGDVTGMGLVEECDEILISCMTGIARFMFHSRTSRICDDPSTCSHWQATRSRSCHMQRKILNRYMLDSDPAIRAVR